MLLWTPKHRNFFISLHHNFRVALMTVQAMFLLLPL